MYWFDFFVGAVIIVFAGARLTVYADKLSDELNWSKAWIGIVLLGLVTSLPEAITSLVAIVSLHANDLAVGNLLGSNNFNPMLIVVMDVIYRQGSITNRITPSESHQVSSRFAMFLIFIVIVDIVLNKMFPSVHLGPVSVGGIFIVILYFVGMKQLANLNTGGAVESPSRRRVMDSHKKTLIRIWIQLLISAVLVIVGALLLAQSADTIAEKTGLGQTFVGSIFLAFVTSLPEMVVSLSALRMGSLDLAIGNIFGSSMSNVFILFVCGLFNRQGPILGEVSGMHMGTATLSIFLTYMVIKGINTRAKKTVFGLGIDSIIMIVAFVGGTGILYLLKP